MARGAAFAAPCFVYHGHAWICYNTRLFSEV